jgi:hypothetical protein
MNGFANGNDAHANLIRKDSIDELFSRRKFAISEFSSNVTVRPLSESRFHCLQFCGKESSE